MGDERLEDRLLTIDELADKIHYSVQWVRDQVNAGKLPAIKFNARAWRFHWPSVLAALQKLS
jgi:hypothetical protein